MPFLGVSQRELFVFDMADTRTILGEFLLNVRFSLPWLLHRSNSSILGRKLKNQKKAEKKRRSVGRRNSDSEAHGSRSDTETDSGVHSDADEVERGLSVSLESLTIREDDEDAELAADKGGSRSNPNAQGNGNGKKRKRKTKKSKQEEAANVRCSDEEDMDGELTGGGPP
jgi:hypothetical protein